MFRFGLLIVLAYYLFPGVSTAQGGENPPTECLQFNDQFSNRVQINPETGEKIGGEMTAAIREAIQGSVTPPMILVSPDQKTALIQLKKADSQVVFGLYPAYTLGAPLYLGSDANDGFWHVDITWSPDNQWISYLTHRGDDGTFLTIMDAAGHIHQEQLISTRLEDSVSSFGWSADGRYLAVSVSDSQGGPLRKIEIWLVPDLTLAQLIKPEAMPDNPRSFGSEYAILDWIQWSPRGDWLAYFHHHLDGMTDSLALNLYSPTMQKFLTYDLPFVGDIHSVQMSWSPNGQYIAVLSTQFTDELIGRIDIFGVGGQIFNHISDKALHSRIFAGGGYGFPFSVWSLDGQTLFFVEQLPSKSHNLGALVAYLPEKKQKVTVAPHIYMNPNSANGIRYLLARSPDDGQDHTTPESGDHPAESLLVVDTNTLEQISVTALRSRPYLSQVYGTYSEQTGWLFLSEDEIVTWAVNLATWKQVALFPPGWIEKNWNILPQYFPETDGDFIARIDPDGEQWVLSIRFLSDDTIQKIEHPFPARLSAVAISPDRKLAAVRYGGIFEIFELDGSLAWHFDDMADFQMNHLGFAPCSRLLASQHAAFTSPDGRYSVIVFAYASGGAAMPGQGTDGNGYARVVDADGTVLCEMDVPLVNDVDEASVRWRDGVVSLPGVDGFEGCPLR